MQVVSDIHLEFYKKLKGVPKIPVLAPILVLAGDVGYPTLPIFWEFLTQVSKSFEHVLLVPGNHEYYHTNNAVRKRRILTIHRMDEFIQVGLEHHALKNVHFLQKSDVILNDIRFIGATLWTYIPDESAGEVVTSMADFKRCYVENSETNTILPPTVAELNALHIDHAEYLRRTLGTPTTAKKTVVVTHHIPSFRLIAPQYKKSRINCAFASDVLDTLENKPDVWICGHSHVRTDTVLDGVRVIMNAIGYPDELSPPTHEIIPIN